MFYYYDMSYFIYALVTFAATVYAHFKVKSIFKKYSKVKCEKCITGLFIAEKVLLQNNVGNVSIDYLRNSNDGDNFDPRFNKINLSESVYFGQNITSAGVAAHEAGHAVQYSRNYLFIKLREKMFPITRICSGFAMPLVFIGLILPVQFSFVVNLGILLFTVVVLFHVVTLPVELDASNRAIVALKSSGYLTDDELKKVKEVLKAAAFTYVASLFTSLMTLIRLVFLSSRRRDD